MIAFQQVCMIAMLISVGYFLGKRKIFSQETGRQLSWLLIHLVTPMVIFKSFQMEYSPQKLLQLSQTFLLALLSFAAVIGFSFLYWGRSPKQTTERLSTIFSNVGFMGLPLVSGIYGDEGVIFASVMVMVFNIVYFTYGMSVIRREFSWRGLKNILLSPTILSVFAGIGFFLLRLPLPEPFAATVGSLAALNTPLAMVVAGLSIARSDLKSVLRSPKVYKMALGKLLLAPLVTGVLFLFLPIPGLAREIIVLQTGCPTAALVGISLLEAGKDNQDAVDYFALTTLLSILTIPFIKFLAQQLF